MCRQPPQERNFRQIRRKGASKECAGLEAHLIERVLPVEAGFFVIVNM
jgi:hypothetical protein